MESRKFCLGPIYNNNPLTNLFEQPSEPPCSTQLQFAGWSSQDYEEIPLTQISEEKSASKSEKTVPLDFDSLPEIDDEEMQKIEEQVQQKKSAKRRLHFSNDCSQPIKTDQSTVVYSPIKIPNTDFVTFKPLSQLVTQPTTTLTQQPVESSQNNMDDASEDFNEDTTMDDVEENFDQLLTQKPTQVEKSVEMSQKCESVKNDVQKELNVVSKVSEESKKRKAEDEIKEEEPQNKKQKLDDTKNEISKVDLKQQEKEEEVKKPNAEEDQKVEFAEMNQEETFVTSEPENQKKLFDDGFLLECFGLPVYQRGHYLKKEGSVFGQVVEVIVDDEEVKLEKLTSACYETTLDPFKQEIVLSSDDILRCKCTCNQEYCHHVCASLIKYVERKKANLPLNGDDEDIGEKLRKLLKEIEYLEKSNKMIEERNQALHEKLSQGSQTPKQPEKFDSKPISNLSLTNTPNTMEQSTYSSLLETPPVKLEKTDTKPESFFESNNLASEVLELQNGTQKQTQDSSEKRTQEDSEQEKSEPIHTSSLAREAEQLLKASAEKKSRLKKVKVGNIEIEFEESDED